MSQESSEWLNTLTLIGFTEQRGNAWHYSAAMQGDEPNHYPQAIPVEDVERRLFAWEVLSQPLFVREADGTFRQLPDRQAMVADNDAPVPGACFGVFKDGYTGHAYREWLLRNVETILGDVTQIGSAGLLREGAQAWVSVEVPESMTTPSGVVFRPQLIAATSYDGSLATTYKRSNTIVRCDNTLGAGLSDEGERYKLKHTRYSQGKVLEAREALGIIFETGDTVSQEIERLLNVEVTPQQWVEVLDIMVPLTDKRGIALDDGRSKTMAVNKRNGLIDLYLHDDRVAPWAGTAYGVLAAYNTHQQHSGIVRGTSRTQRNAGNAINGTIEQNDLAVVAAMARVGLPVGVAA